MTLEDVLIIAPYNAQVFKIQERLPRARVGTVDKLQVQEAPVVIYSMATSTPVDAPHGMEFLYSLNRLNVATSRARCVCAGGFARVGCPPAPDPQADATGPRLLPIPGVGGGNLLLKQSDEKTSILIARCLEVQ